MLFDQYLMRFDLPAKNHILKSNQLRSPFGDLPNVTVRKLLNHTSGLSRHSQMFIGHEIESLPGIEETIRRYGVLTKPAGETFEYSNLGYGVLSHIVSRTSNQTFADFLRQRVFLPLGMTRSFYARPANLVSSTAVGYSPGQKPVAEILSDTPGAADVYSSVHDLLLFGMFHLNEKTPGQQQILKDETLTEMRRESAARGISRYGLGWESLQIGRYNLVYHHGSNGYGTSVFVLLPEKRICISILSNITTPQTEPLADDILKILVSDYEENLDQFRKTARRDEAPPYKPTAQYLGHWKGSILTWNEEIPVEMWFQADGDVQIQMRGQYRNLLNGVRFDDQFLRGSFQGNIGTRDAGRYPYNLHLRLKLRGGGVLNGSITSTSISPQGNVLSSWVELERQK
jgi:CubicO group peptidase (beta-lactamase class C family)